MPKMVAAASFLGELVQNGSGRRSQRSITLTLTQRGDPEGRRAGIKTRNKQ